MSDQLAGESDRDFITRLESELVAAEEEITRAHKERDEASERSANAAAQIEDLSGHLEFLREQLADLALNIKSPSAPTHRSEMARLLNGLLDGQHWQHCTWRVRRAPPSKAGTAKE